MAKIVGLLLIVSASAIDMHDEDIVSMPMHRFSKDCGKASGLHITPGAASLLQNVPGAGIDKFEPFETVLKDGFMLVDCRKDYMYYRGDKFGDNKHDYKLGPVSNVSIVHYDAFVAKMDQAEMTPAVCFEFCRTVPNMGFFGIVNGRSCYCTPYYKPMESDSAQCDSVCEGDNTQMCGGKSKSSLWAMHMCDSTADDVSTSSGKALSMKASMDSKSKEAKGLSASLQGAGEALQKSFGQVGDSGMTGHAQNAKVFAGKLEAATKAVDKVSAKLGDLAGSTKSLKDFTDPDTVTKAERTMEAIDETMAEGEAATDKLDTLLALAQHEAVSGAVKQYYPAMYFVDKEFDDVPSTCTGEVVAEPLVGSADACAAACDSHIHECVGFQYVELDSKTSGCMLLSSFKTGFYYTGCGKSFLQVSRKAAPFTATCYAKLSKFEGTTLKPNPSGKCKQCFKELTKADRCY
jgi:hypothetical protein